MKFKDVAHLYIGCRMMMPDGDIYTLIGVCENHLMLNTVAYGHGAVPEDAKPILHRLEDLTAKHSNELINTEGKFLTAFSFGQPPRWLKLLSWGYDLFGLIDSGEAIDAKTMEVIK